MFASLSSLTSRFGRGRTESILRDSIQEAVMGYDVTLAVWNPKDIAMVIRRLQKMAGEGTPKWDKGKLVFESGGIIKVVRGDR